MSVHACVYVYMCTHVCDSMSVSVHACVVRERE